jgi:hypothetical protein
MSQAALALSLGSLFHERKSKNKILNKNYMHRRWISEGEVRE